MRVIRILLPALALVAAAAAAGPAAAGGDDLVTIARKDYLSREAVGARGSDTMWLGPEGHRIGPYLVYPSVDLKVTFDDNVFRDLTNRSSAFRYELSPSLVMKSQFNRGKLDLTLDGRFVSYDGHEDQQFIGGKAIAEWQLDIDNADAIGGRAFAAYDAEDRLAPDLPEAAAHPVRYRDLGTDIKITHDLGRLTATAGGQFELRDFEDTESRTGAVIDQDFRDNSTAAGYLRLSYEATPDTRVFAGLKAGRQVYWEKSTLGRDSWQYRASTGLDMKLDPVLTLALTGGYAFLDFDDGGTSGHAIYGAELQWQPSALVTVRLGVDQDLAATTVKGAEGAVSTRFSAIADYQIWRNLSLHAGASYLILDYAGATRHDTGYSLSAGANYSLNDNVAFTFDYEHLTRNSSVDAFDDDDNRYTAGVTFRF